MLYSIAIVGRPNVGKSTLFNQLVGNQHCAIVGDLPGLTRDRHYADTIIGTQRYLLIDTPGIGINNEVFNHLCTQQTELAMQEADAILFVVSAREGVLATEHELAQQIRALSKPIFLIINKIDGLDLNAASSDFYELGLENTLAIAATHRYGLQQLKTKIFEECQAPKQESFLAPMQKKTVTVLGRPNVGKSTLINRLLGEPRVIASDLPGTTRDSIAVDFEYEGKAYQLIDTAGIRRKANVMRGIEQISVIQSLRSLSLSDFAFILIDAQENLVDQDLHLIELAAKTGVAIILLINKWDGLDEYHKNNLKQKLKEKLRFIEYIPIHFISALHGSGVGLLFKTVKKIQKHLYQEYSTALLTQILEKAVEHYPEPKHHNRRIKLRYAHLGGHKPLTIIIHGKQTTMLKTSYKRYLLNAYRKALDNLVGIPIQILFKTGENPYKNKRNKLTPHQINKRKRLIKYLKKKR